MTFKYCIPDPVLQNILNARKTGFEEFAKDPRNANLDPMSMYMAYDFERAPITSNKEQLESCGVSVPHPNDIDDAIIGSVIHEIRQCLAQAWNVWIINTDHLYDFDLYRRLYREILPEKIRQHDPTNKNVREIIDIRGLDNREYEKVSLRDDVFLRTCPMPDR